MDIVGRWGGEEFMIILPDAAQTDALNIAERLRSAVRSPPVVIDNNGASLSITISIGVRCVSLTAAGSNSVISKNALLEQVDDALYHAKHLGRDQVCEWNESTPKKSGNPNRKLPDPFPIETDAARHQ